MKKKVFSLLVPCVSLILSGCGGGSNDSNQSTENPPKNVNRAPIAVNDTVTTFQNTSVTINPIVNDSDPDGDELTLTSISVNENHATAVFVSNDITITPINLIKGDITINYSVSDSKGGETSGNIIVTIKESQQGKILALKSLVDEFVEESVNKFESNDINCISK
ncbi:cadherin-like domain-containing protein, partial [Pseudoalteromonas luteoviolacea]|uniref:Ig-like domain-containing protein n=1 Tax=Pseudoalteromonas luteoviolacea TaxID=43657 RepID=UPI001B39D040